MSRTIKLIRKVIALVVGVPIVIIGIILVPLPGPGFLIMFLGLFIISLEFEWAKKHVDTLRAKFKSIITQAQERADKISGVSADRPTDDRTKTDRSKTRQ